MSRSHHLLLAAAGATAVNLAFWLAPTRRLARALRRPPPRPPARPAPLSVVAAARNEARRLPAALDGLLAQEHPRLEVVVCDDDSDDDTPQLLAARAADPRLRVVSAGPKRGPGKKHALATAIAHARHDWLLATDADCRPASVRWAATLQAAAGPHAEIVLGYGPYRRLAGGGWLNRWIRYEAFYTAVQYFSAALAGRPYMGVGRNLLYARRLYDRLGGFRAHAHLAGGDDDLLVNAGGRAHNVAVCLAPEAWAVSEPHRTWAAYARQKRRHLSAATAYRLADRLWLGALAASHLGHYLGVAALAARGRGRWAALLYGARLAGTWPRAARLARGMGVGDLAPLFPLADAGVAAYYLLGSLAFAPRADRGRAW